MTDSPYNLPPSGKAPNKPAESKPINDKREPLPPKVSAGQVSVRKPSLGKRIASTFSGDDIHSIGNYVLMDVVMPAIKDLLFDVVNQGTSRALFGEGRARSGRATRVGGGVYTAYNTVSKVAGAVSSAPSTPAPVVQLSHRERSSHDFSGIVLDNRGTAEEILDTLRERIKEFDVATVADFYDLVDMTHDFPDVKWGWTDPTMGRVARTSNGGFVLDLPAPMSLD